MPFTFASWALRPGLGCPEVEVTQLDPSAKGQVVKAPTKTKVAKTTTKAKVSRLSATSASTRCSPRLAARSASLQCFFAKTQASSSEQPTGEQPTGEQGGEAEQPTGEHDDTEDLLDGLFESNIFQEECLVQQEGAPGQKLRKEKRGWLRRRRGRRRTRPRRSRCARRR